MQISDLFKKPGEQTVSMGSKILSGLASGAIGITVANVGGAAPPGAWSCNCRVCI
jgi:hypothetical protein